MVSFVNQAGHEKHHTSKWEQVADVGNQGITKNNYSHLNLENQGMMQKYKLFFFFENAKIQTVVVVDNGKWNMIQFPQNPRRTRIYCILLIASIDV